MEEIEPPSAEMRREEIHDPFKKCKRSMLLRVAVTCCLQTKKLSVSSFKSMGVRKIRGIRVIVLEENFSELVRMDDDKVIICFVYHIRM